MPDMFHFEEFPRRYKGVDAEGHRVYVTATRREMSDVSQTTTFCGTCNAYVTATWEMPEESVRSVITRRASFPLKFDPKELDEALAEFGLAFLPCSVKF